MSLRGKVALVTGGSRGIGRSVAIALAEEGAHIAINYLRNQNAAEQTSRKIRKFGKRVILLRRNVANPDDVKAMFQEIRGAFGRLDVFVHSASLGSFKPLIELNPLQIDRMFDINARAFVTCSQEARRLMRGGGIVIAISSLGSQRFIHGYGGIAIAKACLEAAVRYLAVELAPFRIRVNAVSGGAINTEGLRSFPNYQDRKKECIAKTPYRRLGRPEDIANIVRFLCQDASSWICGQTIVADGGLSLPLLSLRS